MHCMGPEGDWSPSGMPRSKLNGIGEKTRLRNPRLNKFHFISQTYGIYVMACPGEAKIGKKEVSVPGFGVQGLVIGAACLARMLLRVV